MTETLAGYIDWMGGLDFDACPFRDADALVLCVISYFDVTPLFDDGRETVPVSDCVKLIENGGAKLMITGGDMGNTEIFEKAVRSVRFGGLNMTRCVNGLRADPPYQFFAVTFENAIFRFVAFRGTDSSLAGWRENFMISFTRTEAQDSAAEYAERAFDDCGGRDFYVAGHSKGGNLALYAAGMLSGRALRGVKRVYSLDGPGFCPEVLDTGILRRIDPVTTRIIPEFDLIGKLFEPQMTDTRIIKRYRSGIEQHSLASWLVEGGELALTGSVSQRSVGLSRLVNDWIGGVSMKDRPTVVNELFDTLGADGVTDLSQMNADTLAKTVLGLSKTSGVTRKNLIELPKRAIFDDTLSGEKADKAGKKLSRIFGSDLFVAFSYLIAGVVVLLMMNSILEVLALILLSATAAFQLFITVRALIKNRFRLDGLRERIYITIVLIALIPVVIFKENAMFLMGSVIFGLAMMIIAYLSGERAKSRSGFDKVAGIIEIIVWAAFGIAFLVIPRSAVPYFAMSAGILMICDALARFIALIVKKSRE
ncbi:MAG: DUF2974 domain-containing protein [Clostridia bacterium]|nr:DUF2974 domain-containing protein [Clostridia bacterium]